MDKEILVKKVQAALQELANAHGPIPMVMLKTIDSPATRGRPTLLVSASWLDEKSPMEAINQIFEKLDKHLGHEVFSHIHSIVPIHTSDPFVQNIRRTWGAPKDRLELSNVNVSGTHIEVGTLLGVGSARSSH